MSKTLTKIEQELLDLYVEKIENKTKIEVIRKVSSFVAIFRDFKELENRVEIPKYSEKTYDFSRVLKAFKVFLKNETVQEAMNRFNHTNGLVRKFFDETENMTDTKVLWNEMKNRWYYIFHDSIGWVSDRYQVGKCPKCNTRQDVWQASKSFKAICENDACKVDLPTSDFIYE